jgi:hypothetical protein
MFENQSFEDEKSRGENLMTVFWHVVNVKNFHLIELFFKTNLIF